MKNSDSLPLFVWLVIPVLFLFSQLVMQFIVPPETLQAWLDESGPVEILQAILMTIATCVAFYAVIQVPPKVKPWLFAWLAIAFAGCFFVAGEEISWGQFIFKWDTPEYWAEINDDNETNLHQLTPWLNVKLKILLSIGIYFGGLIIPLLLLWKPKLKENSLAIIFPPNILAVSALCVLLLKVAKEVMRAMEGMNPHRFSEIHEAQVYWFILLYLVIMARRAKSLT